MDVDLVAFHSLINFQFSVLSDYSDGGENWNVIKSFIYYYPAADYRLTRQQLNRTVVEMSYSERSSKTNFSTNKKNIVEVQVRERERQ